MGGNFYIEYRTNN